MKKNNKNKDKDTNSKLNLNDLPEEAKTEISPNPLCTKEQFQKLLLDNINFPYSIVLKEFSKYPQSMRDDLNSAAMEGMVYAATKYDPSRQDECKFISYAIHWIRYYINEEIRRFYPIKFNQNFVSKRNKVKRCIEQYKEDNNGASPDVKYISQHVGMSEKVVNHILSVNGGDNFTFISFNSPSINESSGDDMKEVRQDSLVNEYLNTAAHEPDIAKDMDLEILINNMKSHLSGTEFRIFNDYYFNSKSFTEIAKDYNLRFPSKAAYIIKKCEKLAKDLYFNDNHHDDIDTSAEA